MRVEVIRAWSHRHESVHLDLPAGACVRDALAVCGLEGAGQADGLAIFGVAVGPETPLSDGDRVELLRPLLLDPKEARRRRAASR